jgi:predicted RNase H-like HicB family nuclease
VPLEILHRAAPCRNVPVTFTLDLTGRRGDNEGNRRELMELTAVLTPAEEGGYVALNPETGTTTQGDTVEEAVANLREATALYLSEFPLPSTGHPVVTVFTIPAPSHA